MRLIYNALKFRNSVIIRDFNEKHLFTFDANIYCPSITFIYFTGETI